MVNKGKIRREKKIKLTRIIPKTLCFIPYVFLHVLFVALARLWFMGAYIHTVGYRTVYQIGIRFFYWLALSTTTASTYKFNTNKTRMSGHR